MQRKLGNYNLRKRQESNRNQQEIKNEQRASYKKEQDYQGDLIKSQKLNRYLIELITSNDSSLLNKMSTVVRKYIHASWLIDPHNFKRLQDEFLIKPLFELFKEPLKEKCDHDISIKFTDIDSSIKKIFHKFLEQNFVNECCITLIKKTSGKILENSNDKNEPRKKHIFGVLNQIYNDSTEGYSLIKLGSHANKDVISNRIPKLNEIVKSELTLTENNFDLICKRGWFGDADTDKAENTRDQLRYISFLIIFLLLVELVTNDPVVSILSTGLIITGLCILGKIYLQSYYDYSTCTTEKNIHQELANELISAEILDNLLQELDVKEELKQEEKSHKKKTYPSKKFDTPIIVYREKNEEIDCPYSNSNPNKDNIERIHKKKIKVNKNIIEIKQKLDPIQSNIRITWTFENKEYIYCSNAIKDIVPLHSPNSYLTNFANNNYAYFNKELVWKAVGDKTKYGYLKNAFYEGAVAKSINDTGFTYRTNENQDWTFKLKIVHKKGTGHLNMLFKPVAETKSVANNGEVTISKLYMPTKIVCKK
jgi:hypothetical protein